MIIVDVETTGTNPAKNSLASIGAIDFADPTSQFHEECQIWAGAHVDDEALAINGFTRTQLGDPRKQSEADLVTRFLKWLEPKADHTLAGQNPFFDVGFIQSACARTHINFTLAHRIIDLHSITYFDMVKRGIPPPISHKRSDLNSDAIMKYVGIPAEPHPHVALNGAKWEAEAFHRLFYGKPMFEEFKKYAIPWL